MRKIALITGATSGIGAEFAIEYAKKGYDLIITGRRKEKINAFAKKLIETYKISIEVLIIELSDNGQLDNFIEKIKQRNDIEVLVNNAGFGYYQLLSDGDLAVFEKMIKVHNTVPVALTHSVLPNMLKNNKGTIINVSSDGAFLLVPKNGIYSSTKAFLKIFTESLYLELIETNIKVQALCPSLTRTDFHEKMGMSKNKQKNSKSIKWMTPEEVVKCSLIALDKNEIVCIPGKKTKLLIKMTNLLPRKQYYRLMYKFWKKNFNKK